jgi:hypothetical protein
MKKTIFTLSIMVLTLLCKAQSKVNTDDVKNFWEAFDSIQSTNDKIKLTNYIQKLYIDKASMGLKVAIEKFKYKPNQWVEMIEKDKQKLVRIRPFTANTSNQEALLNDKLAYFKQIYPNIKKGNIYFFIGIGEFGGNALGENLVIGCEVMANDTPDWAISMSLHEYVHTQQTMKNYHFLAHCIDEGMADFVAELINQKSLATVYPGGYIDFGYKNEAEIWNKFKNYIGSNEENGTYYNWMYGSKGIAINGTTMKDLGYFMGYQICKSYYENATDKTKALTEIIEADLSKDEKAKAFLLKSGYVKKKDLKYVQNLTFGTIVEKKLDIKKKIYGYKETEKEIIFNYEIPKSTEMESVKTISVAGSFNSWNPKDVLWQLKHKSGRIFQLQIPKEKFEKGKMETFKFVLNSDNWQNSPETALNVEENGYGNLTLKIK